MPGPLTGYRVIDLSAFVAGPLATQLLAEQGADVVKVEPLQGDSLRRIGTMRGDVTAMFLSVNRNKRSIALDLRTAKGKGVLRRLIEGADVLFENFRPGAMEGMGFGPDEVLAQHGRLIYARVSGFGPTGPRRREPVFDTVIQGYSGMAWDQGANLGHPELVRTLLADKVAPLLAAQAVTAALLERERSGSGQLLELSMLDSLVWWLWPDNMMDQTFVETEGVVSSAVLSAMRLMKTADGYITLAPQSLDAWQTLARLSGREDWLEDARFATTKARQTNLDAWFDEIEQEASKRTTAAWLELLAGTCVPHAPVHTTESIVEDEQIRANGLIDELHHDKWGRLRQPKPVAKFGRTPGGIETLAPDLGEHSTEILGQLGYSNDEIGALRDEQCVS